METINEQSMTSDPALDFFNANFEGSLTFTEGVADVSNARSKTPGFGNFVKLCSMLVESGTDVSIDQQHRKALQILREKGFGMKNPEALGTVRGSVAIIFNKQPKTSS